VGTLPPVTSERDLDDLFQDLWRLPRFASQRHGFQPQIDCFRREQPAELHVLVQLPGVDPEQVQLSIEGRVLTIAGERRRPAADSRLSYYRLEIEYGPFRRRLALPEDGDIEATRASYERGVLTIVVPIAPRPAAPDRVSIRVKARQ
jgi:HSP20 family protein